MSLKYSVQATSMANATTKPSELLTRHDDYGQGQMGGTTIVGMNEGSGPGPTVQKLLGKSVNLGRGMNMGAMTMYEGPGQSTYGIPFAIDGTATVVEDKISIWLAGFQDPIKAVFSTSVHPNQKIIFKRKYVKGGQALVVPERAPARTVSVAFDQREERLTRHAIALEQNLNLYLREQDAKEDLDMKLEAIQNQLQQAWVSIAYEKAFSQGTNIVHALQRGDARFAMMKDEKSRILESDQMYVDMFCGVVSKSEHPFKNLAAAIARANIYTPTGASREKPAVMLVPPGMIDLTRFTKESEMTYSVTGLRTDDGKNKITLPLPNVMEYPDANIKVMVHMPPASFREHGAAHPQVEQNELQQAVVMATYYEFPFLQPEEGLPAPGAPGVPLGVPPARRAATYAPIHITDFEQRSWKRFDSNIGPFVGDDITEKTCYKACTARLGIVNAGQRGKFRFLLRPQMVTLNDSAILSTRPGAETGEMLYSYPSAHASSSQHVAAFVLTLTVYFGAAVRNPERLLILNGIKFSGIVQGHGTRIQPSVDLGGAVKDIEAYNENDHDLLYFESDVHPSSHPDLLFKDPLFHQYARDYDLYDETYFNNAPVKYNNNKDVPIKYYRGAVQGVCDNNGHLGVLDNPAYVSTVQGYNVFQRREYQPSLVDATKGGLMGQ